MGHIKMRLRISSAPMRPGDIRCAKRASMAGKRTGGNEVEGYDPFVSRWVDWHRAYDVADGPLALRLAIVQRCIGDTLTAAPPGPVRAISMCAGEGRDLLGVLAHHPRGNDATGRLVELDPALAAHARAAAPEGIEVHGGDAAT